MEVLGTLGTDDAALALEPYLAVRTEAERNGIRLPVEQSGLSYLAQYALREIKGQVAGDILARHGLHHELALRRDPRAAPLALDDMTPPHYRGANSLRLLGDPSHLPVLQGVDPRTADSLAWFTVVLTRQQMGDETAAADLQEIAADQSHPQRVNARLLLGLEP
jgi:hypothetical protein